MQIKCPTISDALIQYLSAVFPDKAANPAEIDPNRAYGRAEVVRHLRAVKQEQEEYP